MRYLLLFFSAYYLIASEPSAFNSDGLEKPLKNYEQEYQTEVMDLGLQGNEKIDSQSHISINSASNQNSNSLLSLTNKVNSLDEKVDGLRSITEGAAKRFSDLKTEISLISKRLDAIDSVSSQGGGATQDVSTQIKIQNENIEKIKQALKELSSLIDSINSSYISKNEYEKFNKNIINAITELEKKVGSSSNLKSTDNSSEKSDKKSNEQTLKDAIELYNSKSFDKS
ncbi:MAG: hypothetical protein HXX81_00830, partial [Campylobacterales bacterium]|nr:hypothetical protein [Campylobacterales bacterium]